jgi:putative aminopeptidase FrvX
VGDRGIQVAVSKVKPDIAICFEGCPADDTFTEPYAIQTALKCGPMFRYMDTSVICSPRFQRWVLKMAKDHGIPAQASVREGGGNNGAVINLAGNGVPVVVAGVPVRYIHSMAGITAYEDFENTAKLATILAKELTPEILETF